MIISSFVDLLSNISLISKTFTDEEKLASNLKTVYVKGLPLDLNIDQAEEFFAPHGKTCYIKLRKDGSSKFKG